MADREIYKARLQKNGVTRRDRELSWLRRRLSDGIGDLLNSHEVEHNGQNILITSEVTEFASVKKFTCSPEYNVGYGDYFIWDGIYWLVTERDYDDEVYVRGKITQCNYFLTWQNDDGEIIGRWSVISQVTRYNNGVFEGKVVDNIESTLSVQIPCDAETMKLKREKRFLADIYYNEPYAYKITQRDVLSGYYGDSGLITWAVSQDVYNPETDNADLMIADYWKPAGIAEIVGPMSIRIGQSCEYTSSGGTNWSVLEGDFCVLTANGNTASLQVPLDRRHIGKVIRLTDGLREISVTVQSVY
ncbi:MAG: hypothetical protein J6S14_17290 [Clostridia bacterium]|nr:hypothetical protein [Clostridia bacterium]